MSDNDGGGLLWIIAIAASIWAWSNHEKLGKERQERIVAVQKAEARSHDLEARLATLEESLKGTQETIGMTAAAVDEVSSRVSNNARVANENAVKDMTAAGACGKETVYFKDGGLAIRNKECTVKDLK